MKDVILQWLHDNTLLIRDHSDKFVIAFHPKFDFVKSTNQTDYKKAMEEIASKLSVHIENSKSNH